MKKTLPSSRCSKANLAAIAIASEKLLKFSGPHSYAPWSHPRALYTLTTYIEDSPQLPIPDSHFPELKGLERPAVNPPLNVVLVPEPGHRDDGIVYDLADVAPGASLWYLLREVCDVRRVPASFISRTKSLMRSEWIIEKPRFLLRVQLDDCQLPDDL